MNKEIITGQRLNFILVRTTQLLLLEMADLAKLDKVMNVDLAQKALCKFMH